MVLCAITCAITDLLHQIGAKLVIVEMGDCSFVYRIEIDSVLFILFVECMRVYPDPVAALLINTNFKRLSLLLLAWI